MRHLGSWILCLVFALPSPVVADPSLLHETAEEIRRRLEPPSSPGALVVAGEALRANPELMTFYAARLYTPAWIADDGVVDDDDVSRVDGLLAALERADSHGLRDTDYHLAALRGLVDRLEEGPVTAGELGDLDLLLTDAALVYAAHLVSGRVDPATFNSDWQAVPKEVDLVAWMQRAAASDAPSRAFDELLPSERVYSRLRRALAAYRAMDPWPIPSPPAEGGGKLQLGDQGASVLELRLRLATSGDLDLGGLEPGGTDEPEIGEPAADGPETDAALFDAELEAAVKRFQSRHGLAADGVVGEKSFAALRVPLADRIAQLELNLERWRWLPRKLGERYLLVNIAGFTLQAVEGERTVLEMPAVVGREHRRTPVMSDLVRYLVLNPYWEVPQKLAVEDKLPEIRKDPSFLAREGFQVLRGWGSEEERVDPATVSWSELGPGNFPYRLRQNPGPRNALGRIKFIFPNRFSVYIHDTPSRGIFARPERAVSSGCIRVENPLGLAEWLLRGGAGASPWTRERLEAALATGETRTVPLPALVPVHLEYLTAWVEDALATDATNEDVVHFRTDVYGRDAALAAALFATQKARDGAP